MWIYKFEELRRYSCSWHDKTLQFNVNLKTTATATAIAALVHQLTGKSPRTLT